MGQIYVSPEDAMASAQSFDDIAQYYTDVETNACDMEADVYGAWEGDAASACKETFARIEECLGQLGEEVLVHAGLIQDAVGNYIDQDEYIARSIEAERAGGARPVIRP